MNALSRPDFAIEFAVATAREPRNEILRSGKVA